MSPELLGILLASGAVVSYAASNALIKKASTQYTTEKLMFTRNVTISLIIFAVALIGGEGDFLKYPGPTLFVVGISVILYFGLLLLVRAFTLGKLGLVTAITETKFIPSITVYVLIFGQKIAPKQLVAAVLAVLAIFGLMSRKSDETALENSRRPIFLAVANALIFGTGFALLYYPTKIIGGLATGFLSEFTILLCAMVHLAVTHQLIKKENVFAIWQHIPLAVVTAMGTILYYSAIAVGSPNAVAITMAVSPVANLIFGRLMFKEKYIIREWVSISLVLGALLVLSL